MNIPQPTAADRLELEAIIDRCSLAGVLEALAGIAAEKASHIQENWQDPVTARPWDKASSAIDRVASRLAI